MTTTGSQRID